MNIQTQAMARAVKKPLHAAVYPTRMEPARFKESQYILVDFFAIDAVAYLFVADILPRLHCCVNLFELVGGASAHHSPAQIAEITVALRTRKDIEDDRSIRFDRSAAFVVRVDALIARRNDRVARQPTLRHDRGVDRGFKHFGS